MTTVDRNFASATAWTVLGLSLLCLTQQAVRADDKCPTCQQGGDWTFDCGSMFSKLPGLAHWFGVPATVDGTASRPELWERVGVDFDSPFGAVRSHEFGRLGGAYGCELGEPLFIISAPLTSACAAECCASGKCPCAAATDSKLQTASATTAPAETDEQGFACTVSKSPCEKSVACETACAHITKGLSWTERLIAENAALTTALDSKDAILELYTEMMEGMMELMAEKVELQSRLALAEKLVAERERHHQEIRELAAENLKLKAHAEVTEARHAAEKAQVELAVENERLKWRIAELERIAQAGQEAPRTARKATGY
jgi:hypothetical protein